MREKRILVAIAALLISVSVLQAQTIGQIKQMIEQGQYKQAAIKLRPMADQGNVEAQYLAATLFFDGKGVNKSEAQGVKYATMAADKGYIEAVILLLHHTAVDKHPAIISKYSQKDPYFFFNYINETGNEDILLLDAVIKDYVDRLSAMPVCEVLIPTDTNYKQKQYANQQKLLAWQNGLIESSLWKNIMGKAWMGNNSMKYVCGRIADEIYKAGVEKGPVYCDLIAFKAQTQRYKKSGNKTFDDFIDYTEYYYRTGRMENNKLLSYVYRDFHIESGKMHLATIEDVVLTLSEKEAYKIEKNQKPRYTSFTFPSDDEITDVVKLIIGAGIKTTTMSFWGNDKTVFEFDKYGNYVKKYIENSPSRKHNCVLVQYNNVRPRNIRQR